MSSGQGAGSCVQIPALHLITRSFNFSLPVFLPHRMIEVRLKKVM